MRSHILIAAALILSTSVSAHAGVSRGLSDTPTDNVQVAQTALPADTSAVQTAPVTQQTIAQQPAVQQPSATDPQAATQQQLAQQQALIQQQQMQIQQMQMQQAKMMQMKKQMMKQQQMPNMSVGDAVGYKLHQVKVQLIRGLLN